MWPRLSQTAQADEGLIEGKPVPERRQQLARFGIAVQELFLGSAFACQVMGEKGGDVLLGAAALCVGKVSNARDVVARHALLDNEIGTLKVAVEQARLATGQKLCLCQVAV